MKTSISTRLALYHGISLLLILCALVVYLYSSFHIGLHQEFRDQLQQDVSLLKKSIDVAGDTPQFHPEKVQYLNAYSFAGQPFVRLFSQEGNVLYQSPNLEGKISASPQFPIKNPSQIVSTSLQGKPAQTLYASLTNINDELIGWLEVSRIELSIHRELHRLRGLLIVGIFIGAIMAIGFGQWIARRSLKPIAKITQAANDIQAESPKKRLPANFGVRDELTDLAETLNNLLERLDASLERERHFRADAAHQMFTPLTTILGEIEIALSRPRNDAEYQNALNLVYRQAKRMSNTLEGLLQLSSAESIDDTGVEPLAVSPFIENRLLDFNSLATESNISIEKDLNANVHLPITSDHFGLIIDNLVENALKYTPRDGVISVSTVKQNNSLVLNVRDNGIGLSEEEISRMFDRFYRSDREEIVKVRGAGLGLSIVQAMVQAYGGSISAQSKGKGNGSLLSVVFPL